jgi:hypothetical protein
VLEEAAPGGSVKYWRDESGTHHVPKRPLDEIETVAKYIAKCA